MTAYILGRIFEHNHWANLQIIQACSTLSDEQLDAEPISAVKGSIRLTLLHLIESQDGYLSQLIGIEPRFVWQAPPTVTELQEAASITGEGLLALAVDETGTYLKNKFQRDGYTIEPWVVMLQAINHATEHREQIKSMLSALGVTPPRVDGWAYGSVTNALIPPATKENES
jgi:uncharacterized damage-inducible protein DinB